MTMGLEFKLKRAAGFTMIELMVSVAVLGIMGSVSATVFLKWMQASMLNQAKAETSRDAGSALTIVNKRLSQATASSVVITQYNTNQPPYSQISFSVGSTTEKFYQQGTSLYQITNEGTSSQQVKVLGQNLRCLLFGYPDTSDPTILGVSVTFEKGTFSGQTKAMTLSVQKIRLMN